MLFLKVFPSGPFVTNAMVLACPESKEAALIDPAPGSLEDLLSCVKQEDFTVTKILLTHSHLDHIGDLAAAKQATGAPVYVHQLDASNVRQPGSDGLPNLFTIDPCEPDHFFADGDWVTVGKARFAVIHTPGHTPGGVCFYCSEEKLLISGDTLFQGSIGNLSFATAEPEKMWTSLDRLAELPADTRVYPGHGEHTTIGAEHWLPQAREIFGA